MKALARMGGRGQAAAAAMVAGSLALALFAAPAMAQTRVDWPEFGGNLASSSSLQGPSGITAQNLGSLRHLQVQLPGTVDSAAIYLHGVSVEGARHDVFFLTTTYGKTVAVDANSGKILWTYTPPSYDSVAGTPQITNSSPVADPGHRYLYAASPDGMIQKLAIANGHALWRTPVTRLAKREKLASGLKVYRGHVIAVTDGYIGDQPPYQGHAVVLDAASGKLLHVWNSLCSNRTGLLDPTSCSSTRSAIWGRGGAVIDPARGAMFFGTGNGPYNGKTDWGDAEIELNLDATRMLGNYTPVDNTKMDQDDEDLGDSSPALLGHGLLAQGSKDRMIHLVRISNMAGTAPHAGHEVQNLPTPGNAMMFSSMAVWHHDGQTWLFAADGGALPGTLHQVGGTEAFELSTSGQPKLVKKWSHAVSGTTPVVAGGLLYVFDPAGGLRVYQPTTGKQIADLATGSGHWESPVVIDGHIALPEGNANRHQTSGILDLWSVPQAAHASK